MTTSVQHADDLRAAVCAHHAHAAERLGDLPLGGPAAVAWCSAHLVAADLVLYPAVQRHLPAQRGDVRTARRVDHRLQQALCRLDRRLTGAGTLDHVPVATIVEEVRAALRAHEHLELGLVTRLQAVLSPGEQRTLAGRLAAATDAAPTRPHPHTRHTPLSPVVGWCDALVDRARDAMDGRVDALGRPRRGPRPRGRWASYWMGVPFPAEPTRRDA